MSLNGVENIKTVDFQNAGRESSIKDKQPELKFPVFDDIEVSTKTFIVMTNLILNIDNMVDLLPITEYILVPKRRGRKKKNEPSDPNTHIKSGSVITVDYKNKVRGVDLNRRKKRKDKKRGNYFRNSATIIMIIDNKLINYKVSANGKFQMTGCKHDKQAEECVKWFWVHIKDNNEIYRFSNTDQICDMKKERKQVDDNFISIPDTSFKAIFIPAMRNIDFSLNFCVDREKLDEYFNTCTDYHSLLETSFGYTGVNIKIPIKKSIKELMLKKLVYEGGDWGKETFIQYTEYLDMLPDKDVTKKLKKLRYNTFLVFHSGKTIMSGMEMSFMRDEYYEFLNIIRECYDIIEERLDE